jgi:hypothetical protein
MEPSAEQALIETIERRITAKDVAKEYLESHPTLSMLPEQYLEVAKELVKARLLGDEPFYEPESEQTNTKRIKQD